MGSTDGRKFGEVKIVSSCSRAMDGALLLSRGSLDGEEVR